MPSRLILLVAISLAATSPVPGEVAGLIVPGVRVGPITARTHETELSRLLPGSNPVRKLDWNEGSYRCVTELFQGSAHALTLHWRGPSPDFEDDDAVSRERCRRLPDFPSASRVEIRRDFDSAVPSMWKTVEGIGIGTSIGDLARIAGRAIDISTCPCEFGGPVFNSLGGLPTGLVISLYTPWDIDRTGRPFDPDYRLWSSDIPASLIQQFVIERLIIELRGEP